MEENFIDSITYAMAFFENTYAKPLILHYLYTYLHLFNSQRMDSVVSKNISLQKALESILPSVLQSVLDRVQTTREDAKTVCFYSELSLFRWSPSFISILVPPFFPNTLKPWEMWTKSH